MKRGLVERANKLLGDPSSLAAPPTPHHLPTTPVSSTAESSPPSKMPRFEPPLRNGSSLIKIEIPGETRNTVTMNPDRSQVGRPSQSATSAPLVVSSSAASGSSQAPKSPKNNGSTTNGDSSRPPTNSNGRSRGVKRQRPVSSKDDVEEEQEDQMSTFFLKHQNSALSSELMQLQHQYKVLLEERDERRTDCIEALKALQDLHAVWTQMEVDLASQKSRKSSEPKITVLTQAREGDRNGLSTAMEDPLSGSQNFVTVADGQTPRCTGSGEDVEWISTLLDSLNKLGGDSDKSQSNSDDKLRSFGDRVTKRAQRLRESIKNAMHSRANDPRDKDELVAEISDCKHEIAQLRSVIDQYKGQVAELARTRDIVQDSDRKLRRGLYRLSSGRMKLHEVMKVVEETGNGEDDAQIWMEEANVTPEMASSGTPAGDVGGGIRSAEAQVLQKRIQDSEEVAVSRKKLLEELSNERDQLALRINELLAKKEQEAKHSTKISEEDVKQSSLFTDTWVKLVSAERQVGELKKKIAEMKTKWGTARGELAVTTKGLEDQLAKHNKKWQELSKLEKLEHDGGGNLTEGERQQKEIAELRHKLKQALENVRQADLIRKALEESNSMNESLQCKLDELRQKNASLTRQQHTLQQKPGSQGQKQSYDSTARAPESSDKALRKLHQSTKRLGSERDALLKSNTQLLRQSSEKDDMNAKSLSTILHLKELTEKLSNEKDLLEQQVKTSQQVQLANRLATNARERVMEEVDKERRALEQRMAAFELELENAKQEKEKAVGSLKMKSSEMSSIEKGLLAVKTRCDELVAESGKLRKEKNSMVEALAVSRKEVAESAKRISELQSRSDGDNSNSDRAASGGSSFTKDQLLTQISVLKNRLACDVCHHRDKKCMILRCRHMFCKSCVEENIKNRSRKCPACGQRFDTKEVVDIWL